MTDQFEEHFQAQLSIKHLQLQDNIRHQENFIQRIEQKLQEKYPNGVPENSMSSLVGHKERLAAQRQELQTFIQANPQFASSPNPTDSSSATTSRLRDRITEARVTDSEVTSQSRASSASKDSASLGASSVSGAPSSPMPPSLGASDSVMSTTSQSSRFAGRLKGLVGSASESRDHIEARMHARDEAAIKAREYVDGKVPRGTIAKAKQLLPDLADSKALLEARKMAAATAAIGAREHINAPVPKAAVEFLREQKQASGDQDKSDRMRGRIFAAQEYALKTAQGNDSSDNPFSKSLDQGKQQFKTAIDRQSAAVPGADAAATSRAMTGLDSSDDDSAGPVCTRSSKPQN